MLMSGGSSLDRPLWGQHDVAEGSESACSQCRDTGRGFTTWRSTMDQSEQNGRRLCVPWNKGKLVGQKSPLRLKEIWAIRIRRQLADRRQELSLVNGAVQGTQRSSCF